MVKSAGEMQALADGVLETQTSYDTYIYVAQREIEKSALNGMYYTSLQLYPEPTQTVKQKIANTLSELGYKVQFTTDAIGIYWGKNNEQ